MDKIILIFLAVGIVFLSAFFSGLIIWMTYPHLHILFPNAAENGVLAKELPLWSCICISWLAQVFFHKPIENKSK
jgi:hypothetical protein